MQNRLPEVDGAQLNLLGKMLLPFVSEFGGERAALCDIQSQRKASWSGQYPLLMPTTKLL